MLKTLCYLALSVALSAAGIVHGYAATPAQVASSSKGSILVDGTGMSLYTFAKDSKGKSACNVPCEYNWPPLLVGVGGDERGPAHFSVITRDDGRKQWAYKDKPLYRWVNDHKPGDTTGDGFLNGAWHVARP
ncbi:hypothetical protein [Bradyrhizobium sp.]|uniref:COG4315 family predicted lipoprotein n=1 Tax=Bradyrhizobium sp. TaxID=376 RepID=UPI0025C44908|nr:hypothetical protein [Bradyrhizobium sp.]